MPARWVRAVALSDVHNACKVMLLAMALRMTEGGVITAEPAHRQAKELGIDRARLAERIKEAKDAGLLQTINRPAPGRAATYQGVLAVPARRPDVELRRGTAPDSMRRAAAREILTSELGDAAKVVLMLFVHLLSADGTVYGLRRADYAELLGRSEATIARWVGEATAAGVLVLVDGGTRGRRARYRLAAGNGIGQQYAITGTNTGEQYSEIDTHEGRDGTQHLLPTETLYARALQDQARRRVGVASQSGVLRRSHKGERRSDGGRAGGLRPAAGRAYQRAQRDDPDRRPQ